MLPEGGRIGVVRMSDRCRQAGRSSGAEDGRRRNPERTGQRGTRRKPLLPGVMVTLPSPLRVITCSPESAATSTPATRETSLALCSTTYGSVNDRHMIRVSSSRMLKNPTDWDFFSILLVCPSPYLPSSLEKSVNGLLELF